MHYFIIGMNCDYFDRGHQEHPGITPVSLNIEAWTVVPKAATTFQKLAEYQKVHIAVILIHTA